MVTAGWLAMKATFAFPPLLLCAMSYTIFRDEFFSKYTILSLLACFCFLSPCSIFILNGMCTIRRKPYAEIRLFEELRDCDLDIENESRIRPFEHGIFNRIRQFFSNVYELCVFRPVYGILFTVGFAVLSIICFIIAGMEDAKVEADLHSACTQLIFPSLVLMAVVILIANSGIYTSIPNSECHSYHPFQEYVEMPVSVLFARTFAAVLHGGRINIFYTLLLFVSAVVSVNFLERMKNAPEKTIEELQAMPPVPHIQLLLSALLVFSVVSGFFLLVHMILSAYVKAKRCTWAIIEKNWRRNMRAIEYILPGVIVGSLEDLQAALDAKRIQELTDDEKVAFDYIMMPLWQTRRPFVDMTQGIFALEENVSLSAEELEVTEIFLSHLGSLDKSVHEHTEGSAEQSSSVSATNVTRRHSRQVSFGNIRPAKITKRRQETVREPIDEEMPTKATIDEMFQKWDYNPHAPEDESSRTTAQGLGTPKAEPKRVTRRREYYD